ncbi:helix-turn-helix domain-containing protein [Actinomycetospora endophytica]|uniref:Helix-turn-helix domain-containing protein n=1 Tax=Actinomycetospora endophytica TaxID=2291215 RepID=A0ABS8P5P9_9PSEU|nr:helix-turn-helix domain-containing protein [Actinomycetospora endophytica]MCD2193574.1 helix-turn-helix domain-containing protein [Actinomycetospora endophytica]
MTSDDRLADLEARIAALEGAPARSPGEAVDAVDGSGAVGYEGDVRLHGQVSWTIRYSPTAVLDLPAPPTAEVLAALGHPVRLALVRRLLAGPASAAQLQEAAELSSTGQVYHHLRALTSARVVEQDGRSFRVPTTGVVPVLTMILAAGDVAGLLR